MVGPNCRSRRWPQNDVVDEGYVLVRYGSGPDELVLRPTRGSGGIAIWHDEGRAKRACGPNEHVVEVKLVLQVVGADPVCRGT